MKTKISILLMTVMISLATAVRSNSAVAATDLHKLAVQAVSKDEDVAKEAAKRLREAGPDGLLALFDASLGASTNDVNTLRAVVDSVGQQRDCYASQLYWYTDLEQAKTAARAAGKPILSLRLLGKLDEEYSCANSRFFRTTLYANAEVSKYLRDHFILHWKSVRPVPRITIDFGDGRKIERTITGNSIHYVLDANGQPVDALPGLYGPQAFIEGLRRAEKTAREVAQLNETAAKPVLLAYHQTELRDIQSRWANDLSAVGAAPMTFYAASSGGTPSAMAAGARAMGKARVEAPLLREQAGSVGERAQLEKLSTDPIWTAIAARHSEESRLDEQSRKLITAKQPTAVVAGALAFTKSFQENPMVRVINSLERSIAEDTVRNEYQFHSRLHRWFIDGTVPGSLDQLNSKVYAEMFLTPDSDPWLGLAPADAFAALDNGGLKQQANKY